MLQLAARQIIGKLLNAIIDKFERVRATLNANRPATGFHCWTDSIKRILYTISNVITSVVTEREIASAQVIGSGCILSGLLVLDILQAIDMSLFVIAKQIKSM